MSCCKVRLNPLASSATQPSESPFRNSGTSYALGLEKSEGIWRFAFFRLPFLTT